MRFAKYLLVWLVVSWLGLAVAQDLVPDPPKIAANSYLLMDFHSGRILVEHQAQEKFEPASITKIMTTLVAYRELENGGIGLNDNVNVSEKAWKMGGSRMFIEPRKVVTVEQLLKGIAIQSGNDASVALAEHIAGSEEVFANYMNKYAAELGLQDTQFINSTGWPAEGHLTTARDVAEMSRALIGVYPQYYSDYAVREYTYNSITQSNRNSLLWKDESIDGVKTGHTEAAGYCLVASAERDSMRLISVILGAESEAARARESQKLLNYGFRFFKTYRLYAANAELERARVWSGMQENMPVGLAEDLHVTIPRGRYDALNASLEMTPSVSAPVMKGQQLGRLIISLDGEPIAERTLVALQDMQIGGFFRRIKDAITRFFND